MAPASSHYCCSPLSCIEFDLHNTRFVFIFFTKHAIIYHYHSSKTLHDLETLI